MITWSDSDNKLRVETYSTTRHRSYFNYCGCISAQYPGETNMHRVGVRQTLYCRFNSILALTCLFCSSIAQAESFPGVTIADSLWLDSTSSRSQPRISASQTVAQTEAQTVHTISNTGNSLTGSVLADDGETPLAGVSIFILADAAASQRNSPMSELSLSGTESALASKNRTGTSRCEKPTVPVQAFTCTDAEGFFRLNLANVTSIPRQLMLKFQQQTRSIRISINDLGTDIGSIAFSELSQNQSKIAVVHKFDHALVKSGRVQDKPENNSKQHTALDSEFLLAYGVDILSSSLEYPSFNALFTDMDGDGKADIFNYVTVLLKTSWKTQLSTLDADQKRILLDYVENGGQLFITEKPLQTNSETDIAEYI